MSDFENFRLPRRQIPKTAEAAGLPSDEIVTERLRDHVAAVALQFGEPRPAIIGDSHFADVTSNNR
jgi:hypothetical protein